MLNWVDSPATFSDEGFGAQHQWIFGKIEATLVTSLAGKTKDSTQGSSMATFEFVCGNASPAVLFRRLSLEGVPLPEGLYRRTWSQGRDCLTTHQGSFFVGYDLP